MAEKNNSENADQSNVHQMEPLLPQPSGGASGLNCLRMLDSIIVKQRPALSEGKSWYEDKSMLSMVDLVQVIFGIAAQAKYDIFNNKNEQVLQALESM